MRIRRTIIRRCSLWLLTLAITTACSQSKPQPPPITPKTTTESLQIGLTSAASSLEVLVDQPYGQFTSLAQLNFVPANTETLYDDLESGFLDAILVHNVPVNGQFWFNPIAMDGLVIIAHPDNMVGNLSKDAVLDIFSNRIREWTDLGGSELPISVFSREPGSGARANFDERMMAGRPIAPTVQVASGNSAMLTAVASELGAIGYSMLGAADAVSIMSIDGEIPSTATVAAQTYPMTAPLYFVSLGEPAGELRAFLAWLQSTDGQEVLGEKYGRLR